LAFKVVGPDEAALRSVLTPLVTQIKDIRTY